MLKRRIKGDRPHFSLILLNISKCREWNVKRRCCFKYLGIKGDGPLFTSGTLIAYNHGGSAGGTTSSAISEGELQVRDPGQQKQDVSTLSHDVERANDSISPIFDKEKEQKRLQQVKLISEIGTQSMDIVRTQGAINAANAQKDPAAIAAARDKLIAGGNADPTPEQIATQITNTVMKQYGTGSDYQRAAQAVTAALQGLAGGNIAQALTGAAAPYLAEQIHRLTVDSPEASLMAHAVLGALVAKAQGNSALAGAAGASIGELVARQLYPDKKTEDLTEEERQTVSALSTVAGGFDKRGRTPYIELRRVRFAGRWGWYDADGESGISHRK